MDERISGSHRQDAAYVIGIAIVLAALMVSASVYFPLSSISSSLSAIGLSGSTALLAAAPEALPSPTASPARQAAAQQAPPQPARAINLEGLPFKGGADATVTIVEYSDFQCPFCVRAYPTINQILQEYGGKVKFYYKHFPLSFHQNAQKSAEAFECAQDQGKAWEYYDLLFGNSKADGTGLNSADLKKYAVDLKLDTAKFNACLDGGQKTAKVNADAAEGAQVGVSGTPAFFINGDIVSGAQPYAVFKATIDSKLGG